jgi:membrane protease YdiL (CAAX protease family)
LTLLLKSSFPVFTVIWIAVPLIAVIRRKDASSVGFRKVPLREYIKVTLINFGILLVLMAAFEPWSHTYRTLVEMAAGSSTPDSTFAWLKASGGIKGRTGMLLFSAFVTMFGEELFFRGWLLQLLQRKISKKPALLIQAVLFTIPNLMASFMMPALQGVLYAVVYTWLAISITGGWAASRTRSIWPSLTAAVLCNFILTLFII